MKLIYSLILSLLLCHVGFAQQTDDHFTSRIYGAFGYNAEWYARNDINISQPSLGNKYKMAGVTANDYVGWNKNLFRTQLTIPQYNYRLGFWFKKHKTWGVEANFDHTKYQLTPGESVRLQGTVNNRSLDTYIVVRDGYFHWKLNNGANFLCFNIMKRIYVIGSKNGNFKMFNIYKAGAGPTIPHVENTLFGMDNHPGFQLGGWNFGLEASYRMEFFNYIYLDLAQKLDYARYFGLKVYKGTATQQLCTYEVMATLGVMIPYEPFWKKKKADSTPTATPTNN